MGINTAINAKKNQNSEGEKSATTKFKGLSAFQILLSSLLEADGDMEQMPKKFKGGFKRTKI